MKIISGSWLFALLMTLSFAAHGVHASTSLSPSVSTAGITSGTPQALRFGMSQVGINPGPNDQVSNGLIVVTEGRTFAKPNVTAFVVSEPLASEGKSIKLHGLNVIMANTNRVVGMYSAVADK